MESAVQILGIVKRLDDQAKPSANDIRFKTYVDYINGFLSFFGKERAYLVGSTCEKMKLRWSYHGGDANFLLCSGLLEIPDYCIEHRRDTPCYVWIRAEKIKSNICPQLVLGKYLSADVVREVRPELFTILRAIYTHMTTPSDGIPGRTCRVTIAGAPSKVGLAMTNYRDLKAEGLPLPRRRKGTTIGRTVQVSARLKKRWRGVEIHQAHVKILQRTFKLLAMCKVPGKIGEKFGNFCKFVEELDQVLKRPPLDVESDEDIENEVFTFKNNLDEDEDTKDESKFKVTFTEKTSKDFVPALRVISEQKLACLQAWKRRVESSKWPGKETVEIVYNTDIFLVARCAPKDPDDLNRDFCLSFNLAEVILSESFSEVQRKVFLILKAYLNGYLDKKHNELGRKMKLKTYHLKTAFFWVCEQENANEWTERCILDAVGKCLNYLQICFDKKTLFHYFIESNLLVDFEELDFDILKQYFTDIQLEKINCLNVFFELNKQNNSVEWLTADQVKCIEQMQEDGGKLNHIDSLEDQLIDIVRGISLGPRDSTGQAPVKEAILKVVDIFLEDERDIKLRIDEKNKSGGANTGTTTTTDNKQKPLVAAVLGQLRGFLRSSENPPVNAQRVNDTVNLISMASAYPGASEIVSKLGGEDGIRTIVQQSLNPDIDPGEELRQKIDRY